MSENLLITITVLFIVMLGVTMFIGMKHSHEVNQQYLADGYKQYECNALKEQ